MPSTELFSNPYTPGAGHSPPYLAGRREEAAEFAKLLEQDVILENLVLTGLRGVGKTVLLDRLKPAALQAGWLWVGTDFSESASISEVSLAERLIADLSVVTASFSIQQPGRQIGFLPPQADSQETIPLSYAYLTTVYRATPGLVADKIKAVLELCHEVLEAADQARVIFAYDEAQNLSDHAEKDQFPLSVLLDIFQSIQRKGIPFMLVLTGLPTLFPKLVQARTFSERMFRVVTLSSLGESETREAILKPIEDAKCPVRFDEESVALIYDESKGYPYFVQFICREAFDAFLQQFSRGLAGSVPTNEIQRKLDSDFFAGRWARVTDRQRELMWVIASLRSDTEEFTIQELVAKGRELLVKAFSPSHVSQILARLSEQGLVYKNRFGKYSFAVPLFGAFILRTYEPTGEGGTSDSALGGNSGR